MEYSEEIWAVLEAIERARKITPAPTYPLVYEKSIKSDLNIDDLRLLLEKLEKEFKIVKVQRDLPYESPTDSIMNTFLWKRDKAYFQVEILPKFKTFFARYRQMHKTAEAMAEKGLRPEFDSVRSAIKYGDQIIPIRRNSAQYYVCQFTIDKNYGRPVKEIEVMDAFDTQRELKRTIRDAIRNLNKKCEAVFGIGDMFEYKDSHIRLRKEIFEES